MACALSLPGLRKGKNDLPLSPVSTTATHVPGSGFRIVIAPTERLAARPDVLARIRIAAARWEAAVANDVTVTVAADYGPDFFGAVDFPDKVLAFTDPRFGQSYQLGEMQNILRIEGDPQLSSLWNILPNDTLPVETGEPRSLVKPPLAVAQVLGLVEGDPSYTASMGFSSAPAWDFDPDNGIEIDRYDFDAVAVHELAHALGFATALDLSDTEAFAPLDYYRLRPGAAPRPSAFTAAKRVLTPGPAGGAHVFSTGSLEIPFSTGDGPDGGDKRNPSHWRDEDLAPFEVFGIMKPTFFPRERTEIGDNDVLAMQAIGYRLHLPLEWGDLELPVGIDLGYIPADQVSTIRLPFRNRGDVEGRVSVELVSFENARDGSAPAAELSVSPVAAFLTPGESRDLTVRIDPRRASGHYRATVRLHTNDKSQLLHDLVVAFSLGDSVDKAGWVLY